MTGKYYEEINIGDKIITPGKTITDTVITTIVGLAGFSIPLFLDEEYCKKTTFGGRIAPGRMTLMIMGALTEQSGVWDETVIAMVGLDKVSIVKPVRAGDTLTVEMEFLDKRETSRKDRGIVFHREICRNQLGEVVAQCDLVHLVKRRQSP